MIDYEDNRLKSFEELRKNGKKYGYTEKILSSLENGNFNCLNEIDLEYRNNKAYMEPLLYAVKNSPFGTYEVFKYYGENLQTQDLTMATEIVVNEPDVMEGTAITDNPTLVLYFVNVNPEIVLYISEDLKNDGEFIEELCEKGNKEAIAYAISECNISAVIQDNPKLAQNPEFMKEAVKEDVTILEKAPEELRNNYEFMRDVTKNSREAIDYVVANTDKFGKEAIKATKETVTENVVTDIEQEVEKENKRIQTISDLGEKSEAERKLGNTYERIENAKTQIKEWEAIANDDKQEVGIRKEALEKIIRRADRYLKIVKAMPEDIRKELEQYKTLSEYQLKELEKDEKTEDKEGKKEPKTLQDKIEEMQKKYQELTQAVENGTRKPEDVITFINIQLNLFKEMPEDIKKSMEQSKVAWEAEIKSEKGLEEFKHIEGKSNGENYVEYDDVLSITDSLKLNEITEEPKSIRNQVKKIERITNAVKKEVQEER